MIDFVETHKLQPIIGNGLSNNELKRHLRPQAEIAAKLPQKLGYISPELVMPLAIMGLYDLAVLIDDSTSMVFEQGGERKKALKKVLYFLADLYGAVSNDMRGIKAIRFLNGTDDLGANHLRRKIEIDKVIDCHEFEGLTCIGAGLMRKILKPFVFMDEPWVKGTLRKLRQMERPLLIMIITDGEVEGEDPTWLEQAITSTVDSLKGEGVGTKAVVFQFARVGNDEDAEKFLKKLEHEESKVKEYVDTLSGSDLMELMNPQDARVAEEGNYHYPLSGQQRIIKLLLGPISPDDFAGDPIGGVEDVADDFDN